MDNSFVGSLGILGPSPSSPEEIIKKSMLDPLANSAYVHMHTYGFENKLTKFMSACGGI